MWCCTNLQIKQDFRISANESQPVLDPTSFINNSVDSDMDHVLESDSHSDTNLDEEENSDDDTIGIQILEGPRGRPVCFLTLLETYKVPTHREKTSQSPKQW